MLTSPLSPHDPHSKAVNNKTLNLSHSVTGLIPSIFWLEARADIQTDFSKDKHPFFRMSATDRIKVLVLGDSGVGKSSLVHLISHSIPLTNGSWTIGVSVEVKLHEYNEGTPTQRSSFIELWDVGGSRSHFVARQLLYAGFHGIILVHDLTNRKSHENLRKWLSEVFTSKDLSRDCGSGFSLSALFGAPPTYENIDFDLEAFVVKNIPVLVVATKLDLASTPTRRSRSSSVAQECHAEEILVDCNQARSFAPASTNAVKLSRFLDKVVERKYNSFGRLPFFAARNNQATRQTTPLSGSSSPLLGSTSTPSSTSIFMPSKFSHLD